MSSRSDFECPYCGAEVSPNAAGCRKCGTEKVEGHWVDPDVYDGLDLPDDEFDYEDFVEREFGSGGRKKSGKELFWWIVAIITLIAFLFLSLPIL